MKFMNRPLQSAALGSVVALAMTACAGAASVQDSQQNATQHGTIGMALAGQAPSGAKYRLRNATIELQGPGPTSYISTEDDPNRTLFSTDVIAGLYAVAVDGGWHLERVDYTGQGDAVEASLTSPNPQEVSVYVGVRTPVEFHFQVEGEEIELDKGGIDIGITVDD